LSSETEWLAPTTLGEALVLRAARGDTATVLAGGTFVGILINQRLLSPSCLLSLGRIPGLDFVELGTDDSLRVGAMTRHRRIERSALVRARWPALADAFSLVASPRVRNQATVGGVLADADYASDPPAVLSALGASVVATSAAGEREIPVEELIVGYYETSLRPDELVTELRVPPLRGRAVYRKFRSRSHEDRPCVSVAAARRNEALRVVVGAVAGRLQLLPEICAVGEGKRLDRALAAEIGDAYAEAIDPLSDVRGSAAYRKRVIGVEVRRALEELDR